MKVEVFGRTNPYCSYCEGAKQLLNMRGIPFEWTDVNTVEPEVIDHLRTFGKTLPFIFIDGEYIGGFEQLSADINMYVKRFAISEAAVSHSVEVTFQKSDGTTRVLHGTLNPTRMKDILSEAGLPLTDQGREPKKKNLKVLPILDIESREWRSIPLDRVSAYGISTK